MARITLDPQAGHEQAGRRPALVLSPASYNGPTGLALFCPITRQVKGYIWEVPVPDGLTVAGVVLADEVKNLDWRARQAEFIARMPDSVVRQVLGRLQRLLEGG